MAEPRQGSFDIELLAAHCRSLDPDTPTARERLELVLGRELTAKLLFALAPSARGASLARSRPAA